MSKNEILRNSGVVGRFTAFSRVLGMVRDIIIAYHFGTSLLASAFFVAFKTPNLFRRLFGEGALSAAFIPIFIETRTREGDRAAWNMAAKVVTMTAALLSAVAVIGVIAFSFALYIPALSDRWITTFELARIMFPYVVLICLAALSMAILNSFRHFSTSAFAPCLLNIILIGVMLLLFPLVEDQPTTQVMMLSWAVLLAGAAQVAIQLPALKRFGCPFSFSNRWNDPKVRRMLLLMGPAALGMAVTQFNVLIDQFLAMWIGPWAPAALTYSERMIYLPLGIIATAMGTVLLPTFSTHAAEKQHDAMGQNITDALQHLIFIMTPAALGLLVLAPGILGALFEWNGSFDEQSTMLSARALMFYAPGLIVFSASKVFVPAFYALQDTRTPVRIGLYTVVLNLTLNIIFILTLPEYWKHAGMAFSTVLSECVGMIILGRLLHRKVGNIHWVSIFRCMTRCLILSLLISAVAWLAYHVGADLFEALLPAKLVQIGSVLCGITAGIVLYGLLALLLRMRELQDIRHAVFG